MSAEKASRRLFRFRTACGHVYIKTYQEMNVLVWKCPCGQPKSHISEIFLFGQWEPYDKWGFLVSKYYPIDNNGSWAYSLSRIEELILSGKCHIV